MGAHVPVRAGRQPERGRFAAGDRPAGREGARGEWMVVVTNVLAGERSIDSIQMRPVE